MESTRKHLAERGPQTARRTGDVQRLKSDGAASVAELREFVAQMHGRSPQEVMGAVAESSLIRSLAVSTAGFAALLVVFTIGPYLWGKTAGSEAATAQKARPAAETATAGSPAPEQSNPQFQSPAPADSTTLPTGSDGQKVLDALDIGETKQASPNTNPLDKQLDGLLEGID